MGANVPLDSAVRVKDQVCSFVRGMLQGALMPMAMPNLLVGRDVVIYSQRNNGVTYKLGYTAGVNVCGAIFFGLFFWWVSRWRASVLPNGLPGR